MMRTPLYDEHCRLGAKMTEFGGWEMPLYYSGIAREVQAVRCSAGIFDVSHMGELFVRGPGALGWLQFLTANDASVLQVGQAQYTLMCEEDGGVLDDLIVYRLDGDLYMLVVNAGNTESDFTWIQQHGRPGAECENRSPETGLVSVQGPASSDLLQPVVDFDISTLPRFVVKRGRVGDTECWIARTGYTGEDGFEIFCSAADCPKVWTLVVDSGRGFGAEPAGLGARDVLRLEAGYPLYGHELTRTTTPVDARLLWVVKFAKPEFLGKEAILQASREGPKRLLVGLEAVERCVPRHGYDVTLAGLRIGYVTSGTFSPTLGKGIAMAYLEPSHAEQGAGVEVQIRGKPCTCNVVSTPFYRSKRGTPAAADAAKGVIGAN
ncbi:MAG TPA: glycine cleavage system aminomethyltransferase GcvT [Armatimonadota bacterium]|nr:glycine cleavage system aminomethyltransferase GcvT [Armatimonadota bacterium]